MLTNKTVLILLVITAVISAAATKFYFPNVTTKIVETQKEVTKTDVQTVIKTVTKDGVIESTTTITDHSQKVETSKKVDITAATKDWLVSASYSTSIHTLEPIYGLQVNRRILGPAYIGALLNNKGQVGLSLGLEF